jgi:hypothetical protein
MTHAWRQPLVGGWRVEGARWLSKLLVAAAVRLVCAELRSTRARPAELPCSSTCTRSNVSQPSAVPHITVIKGHGRGAGGAEGARAGGSRRGARLQVEDLTRRGRSAQVCDVVAPPPSQRARRMVVAKFTHVRPQRGFGRPGGSVADTERFTSVSSRTAAHSQLPRARHRLHPCARQALSRPGSGRGRQCSRGSLASLKPAEENDGRNEPAEEPGAAPEGRFSGALESRARVSVVCTWFAGVGAGQAPGEGHVRLGA